MKKRLVFSSDPNCFAGVRQSAGAFAAAAGFPESEVALMVLAVDEACANIRQHAYGGAGGRTVRLVMERLRSGVRFTLRDYGRVCRPEHVRGRPLLEFRPGGLGVHLIHRAFDSVTYHPCPRGTRLVLVKYFDG